LSSSWYYYPDSKVFCWLHSLSASLQHYLRAYQTTFMLAIRSLRPTLRA
jgi:hypothetical protein